MTRGGSDGLPFLLIGLSPTTLTPVSLALFTHVSSVALYNDARIRSKVSWWLMMHLTWPAAPCRKLTGEVRKSRCGSRSW